MLLIPFLSNQLFYRLTQLLIADEFRCQIALKSGLVSTKLSWWKEWSPLNFGWKNEQFALTYESEDDENDEGNWWML